LPPSLPGAKLFERHGTVAEPVLYCGGKFAESRRKTPRNKERIIAEAPVTPGLVRESPFDGAVECTKGATVERKDDHTPKARRAVLSADVFEILQEQTIVLRICGALA
jgi:hypothetical protein